MKKKKVLKPGDYDRENHRFIPDVPKHGKDGKPAQGHYIGPQYGYNIKHENGEVRYYPAPCVIAPLQDVIAQRQALYDCLQTFQKNMQDQLTRIAGRIMQLQRDSVIHVGLPEGTKTTLYFPGYLIVDSTKEPSK